MSLLVALALEWCLGDPRGPAHPVAAFGRLAAAVEARVYAPSRAAGALAWLLVIGLGVGTVAGARLALLRAGDVATTAADALLIWASLGWRSLLEHVRAVAAADDLAEARARVTRIVGRDTGALDAEGVQRAALESLAENASDAVVAPLFWLAVAGPVGCAAYRMINTLDAMWGHRSARFARFGTLAARADDVASFVPARLTAALYFALGRRLPPRGFAGQARRHPSPNAGWPEAALAHVLGVRLGGPVARGGRSEARPWLGPACGRAPDAAATRRALSLTKRVLLGALPLGALQCV